jgi:hypothetical protein
MLRAIKPERLRDVGYLKCFGWIVSFDRDGDTRRNGGNRSDERTEKDDVTYLPLLNPPPRGVHGEEKDDWITE